MALDALCQRCSVLVCPKCMQAVAHPDHSSEIVGIIEITNARLAEFEQRLKPAAATKLALERWYQMKMDTAQQSCAAARAVLADW
jgi:hypothetical protein